MPAATRIEKVETFLWDRWLLIKIHCEDGTVGIGEGGVHGWQRPTKTMIETKMRTRMRRPRTRMPSRRRRTSAWIDNKDPDVDHGVRITTLPGALVAAVSDSSRTSTERKTPALRFMA